MSKTKARSILYRLIESGQLIHKALLVPLLERGLEPGDDAVLFMLHDTLGASEEALAEEIGIPFEALMPRLERLMERDLISRQAIGADLSPGLALTERGERIREVLAAPGLSWKKPLPATSATRNARSSASSWDVSWSCCGSRAHALVLRQVQDEGSLCKGPHPLKPHGEPVEPGGEATTPPSAPTACRSAS